MHSSPKFQYRKKPLPLPSWWILIWHTLKFPPTKGHSCSCSCPSWSATSLRCLADRNILFFLIKTFLLQFKSITSCPDHNRQKEVIPFQSTGVFFILDICWHILSLKFSSFQFSDLNVLSLLSLTCFPDLIILCIKGSWLIHTSKSSNTMGSSSPAEVLLKLSRGGRRQSGTNSGKVSPVMGVTIYDNNLVHTLSVWLSSRKPAIHYNHRFITAVGHKLVDPQRHFINKFSYLIKASDNATLFKASYNSTCLVTSWFFQAKAPVLECLSPVLQCIWIRFKLWQLI